MLHHCRWTYETTGWDHIAAIAPVVIACATAGDTIAASILASGADAIVDSAAAVLTKLCPSGDALSRHDSNDSKDSSLTDLQLVLCGGLLSDPQNAMYMEAVCTRLRTRFPHHTLTIPSVDAEIGAALLAYEEWQRRTAQV